LGGQQLLRIAFKAYTHEQINDILADRLQNLAGVFDAKSLQLTAVSAVIGNGLFNCP
jgi:Cdc6-like AAA superfamily ATPase